MSVVGEWIAIFIAEGCSRRGYTSFPRFLDAARAHAGVHLDGREVLTSLYDQDLFTPDRCAVAVSVGRHSMSA